MLQYIVRSDDTTDMLSQARQALEGGCRWIELNAPAEVSDEQLAEVLGILKPEISSYNACLTVASRVTLARQAEIDGVQLYEGDVLTAAARRELEGGQIIGLSIKSVEAVEVNMHSDIDYFRFEPSNLPRQLGLLTAVAELLRSLRSDKPLAAAGGITAANVGDVLAAGAEGVAVDSSIADGGGSIRDAVAALMRIIAAIRGNRT